MRVHKVHYEIKLLKHVYQITTVIFISVEDWSANPRLGVRSAPGWMVLYSALNQVLHIRYLLERSKLHAE